MSDRKVQVQSMVRYTVVLTEPYNHFSRVFNRENQSAKIDYDIMEEGLQANGFRNLFYDGTLKVVDQKDRIDLGLEAAPEEEEIDEHEEIISMNTGDMLKLLKSGDKEALDGTLAKASPQLIKNFISTAIKFKIIDYMVIEVLQKYSEGIDITKLLALARDAEKTEEEFNPEEK